MGWAATFDILLLFYPVPRSSFLLWLLGTSFPEFVKYHRYWHPCRACAPSPAYNFLPVTVTFIRHDHSNVVKPSPTTFHRWLGHGTMWVLTLHGWGFYLFWLLQHEWLEGLAFEKYGTNMLSGTLSWVSGAALWLTSLEWVRRHSFEVGHPFFWQATAFVALVGTSASSHRSHHAMANYAKTFTTYPLRDPFNNWHDQSASPRTLFSRIAAWG